MVVAAAEEEEAVLLLHQYLIDGARLPTTAGCILPAIKNLIVEAAFIIVNDVDFVLQVKKMSHAVKIQRVTVSNARKGKFAA